MDERLEKVVELIRTNSADAYTEACNYYFSILVPV